MPGTNRFFLDWVSGSSAVIDLQAQGRDQVSSFLLRYTSPFRPTMRAPQQELAAGPPEFEQLTRDLDSFATRSAGVVRRSAGGAAAPAADTAELAELGQQLFDMVLPKLVRSDLRQQGLFVELGTDEELLHLPWEVMHDGTGFICLKHYVGRYVNLRRTPELQARAMPEPGSSIDDLAVLVVAVPDPKPQDGQAFEQLPSVEREMEAILATLGGLGVQPRVLAGRDATRMRVLRALRDNYHIIHFSGHAAFDPNDPNRSSIVLDDAKLSVASLTSALAEQTAVLCVVNACETTRSGGGTRPAGPSGAGGAAAGDDDEQLTWRDQYNLYGLARAFLENGAYVLGSRWKIPDDAAQLFAETFYGSFLGQGHPIGRAITEARAAVHAKAAPTDFSWASYVYYGDPRLTLRAHPKADATEEPPGGGGGLPMGLDEEPTDAQPTDAQPPDGGGLPMGADEDSTPSGNPSIDDLLGELPVAEPEMNADASNFGPVVQIIETPPSDAEEARALRAAGRMLSSLAPDQKQRLAEVLDERAAAPELLGTDRILLIGQLRARIGE